MKIEIFSDASVHTQSGEAGFAHWISCYQTEVQHAGYAGNRKIASAELFSINNAIEYLLSIDLIPVQKIHIHTDSTEAIHKLQNAHPAALFSMIELTIKNGMRARQVFELFSLHHIKAHSKCSSEAAKKNRWCDNMAKQYRARGSSFKETIFDHSDILL